MDLVNYDIGESLYWLGPELAVALSILLNTSMILLPVTTDKLKKPVILLVLVIILSVNVIHFTQLAGMTVCCLFNTGMVEISQQTAFWKMLLTCAMIVVVLFPLPYSLKRDRSEYYILLLGVLLGGFLLTMANHFLMVIIGLETMSLSSYMLVGLARSKGSVESAIKYFLFGATATAVTLYGISWLYGLTGQLNLSGNTFEQTIPADLPDWIPFLVITLVSSGVLFKVAVAPWHLWVPDVYQETPTPIVAMFSVVPKLAGFGFLIHWVDWLGWPVEEMALLAILTMSIGNFAALRQKNVKRMMGYSSIAHSGFLLMALLNPENLSVFYFYATIYLLMNLAAFLLINYYERKYKIQTFQEYEGFFQLSPYFGIMMVVLMISLTGLPPTAGFTAKLFLFSAIAGEYQSTESTILLITLVFGILNAVVSFAYYVKLPYGMIFKKMNSTGNVFKKYSSLENYLCLFLVLAVLILFFKPDWLMGWINNGSFAY